MTRLIALSLLVSCHVPQGAGRWETDWRGFAPLSGYDCALETAGRMAPCHLSSWGGRVSWYPLPFECDAYGTPVAGCMPAGVTLPVFAVGWRDPVYSTALAHELGHFVMAGCGLPGDEATVEAWAREVNTAVETGCFPSPPVPVERGDGRPRRRCPRDEAREVLAADVPAAPLDANRHHHVGPPGAGDQGVASR